MKIAVTMYCPGCGVAMRKETGPEVYTKVSRPPLIVLRRDYRCPVCRKVRTSVERLTVQGITRSAGINIKRT